MSLNSRVTLSFLLGACGALLAWLIIDFSGIYVLEAGPANETFFQSYAKQAFVGAVFGAFVGMGIGLVNGLGLDSSRLLQRYIGYGAVVGLVGGLVGLFFGQLFYGVLHKDPSAVPGMLFLYFIINIMARAIGWGLIGCIVGYAQGLPSGSKKTSYYGAVGGFIGGMLGGMLFEIIPYLHMALPGRPGIMERGISLTITGASIGFFVGLIEVIYRQA